MSVKVEDRKISKTEYIPKIKELNKVLGHAIHNGPKKYISTYGEILIRAGLDAYNQALAANSINLFNSFDIKIDFPQRRSHLLEIRALLYEIAGTADIYFLNVLNNENSSKQNQDKILKRMEKIGELCNTCKNLINDAIVFDEKMYSEWTDISRQNANNWWERSPNSDNSNNFCNVNSDGNANNNNASNTNGLAPCGYIS